MALKKFREDPRRARLEALSAPAIKKEVKLEEKKEVIDLKTKLTLKKIEK